MATLPNSDNPGPDPNERASDEELLSRDEDQDEAVRPGDDGASALGQNPVDHGDSQGGNSQGDDEHEPVRAENSRVDDENSQVDDEKGLSETDKARRGLMDVFNAFATEWHAGNTPSIEDFEDQLPFGVDPALFERLVERFFRETYTGEEDEHIGPYRILERVTGGGQGVVYRGYDDENMREVALKVTYPFPLSSHRLSRREAQVGSQLHHPGIVPVYGCGVDDLDHYVASEWVEGTRLDTLIGKLSVEETVEIVAKIAEALHYAHDAGVIHRDIKPDNIILEGDQPRIFDFGVAHASFVNTINDGEGRFGAAAYASPEHEQGKGFDRRSDLFCLGIILYQLLTRELPFRPGADPEDYSHVLEQDVEPLTLYAPDLPMAVEEVCLKALMIEKEERYQTCQEFAEALRAAMNDSEPAPPSRELALEAVVEQDVVVPAYPVKPKPKLAFRVGLLAVTIMAVLVFQDLFRGEGGVGARPTQPQVRATVATLIKAPTKHRIMWIPYERGELRRDLAFEGDSGQLVQTRPGEHLLQWTDDDGKAACAVRNVGGGHLSYTNMWSVWNQTVGAFDLKPLTPPLNRPRMKTFKRVLVSDLISEEELRAFSSRPYSDDFKISFDPRGSAAVTYHEAVRFAEFHGCVVLSANELDRLNIRSDLPEWTSTWDDTSNTGDVRIVRNSGIRTPHNAHRVRRCFRLGYYLAPLATNR